MCIYICVYMCGCVYIYIAFRQFLIYKRCTNKYIIWSCLFKLVIIFKLHFKPLSIWILWFLGQNVLFTNGCWCVCVLVTQSCLTLYDPMDYRLPSFSVHWILQAKILEWVAILFSRASFQPRDRTQVSCIVLVFFMVWATREAHGCWYLSSITLQDGAVWANWKLTL